MGLRWILKVFKVRSDLRRIDLVPLFKKLLLRVKTWAKSLSTLGLRNAICRYILLLHSLRWRTLNALLLRRIFNLLHAWDWLVVLQYPTVVLLLLVLFCYNFGCMSIAIYLNRLLLFCYLFAYLLRPRKYYMIVGCNSRTFNLSFKLVHYLIMCVVIHKIFLLWDTLTTFWLLN